MNNHKSVWWRHSSTVNSFLLLYTSHQGPTNQRPVQNMIQRGDDSCVCWKAYWCDSTFGTHTPTLNLMRHILSYSSSCSHLPACSLMGIKQHLADKLRNSESLKSVSVSFKWLSTANHLPPSNKMLDLVEELFVIVIGWSLWPLSQPVRRFLCFSKPMSHLHVHWESFGWSILYCSRGDPFLMWCYLKTTEGLRSASLTNQAISFSIPPSQ